MNQNIPKQYLFSSLLNGNTKLTVVTGAGIDSDSGLSTFRGEEGHYHDDDATYLASTDALYNEPVKAWQWFIKFFLSYHDILPANSHYSLVELEEKIGDSFVGLITQNISGLHCKAGSKKVLEIHGSIREMRNRQTRELIPLPTSWVNSPPEDEEFMKWRPNVCYINESYSEYPYSESLNACESCDLLLVIGTAGIIPTPIRFAEDARKSGAEVLNINPHSGELDNVSDYVFRGTAQEYFNL